MPQPLNCLKMSDATKCHRNATMPQPLNCLKMSDATNATNATSKKVYVCICHLLTRKKPQGWTLPSPRPRI